MDVRIQKLEQQRQIMEQKMKQKRLTSGMIQASDILSNSAKSRTNGNRRALYGYDGPLQYTMVNDNPDQVISILPVSDGVDVSVVEDLTNVSSDIMDIEDEESSPVAAAPIENGNMPVNPIPDKPAFIHQTNGVKNMLILILKFGPDRLFFVVFMVLMNWFTKVIDDYFQEPSCLPYNWYEFNIKDGLSV